jgi:hypothetical protein
MNDFGLDRAVVGKGRTAALVEPSSRIVWWVGTSGCYPRFDGDPIFPRLLAGGEEKGFCDVAHIFGRKIDHALEHDTDQAWNEKCGEFTAAIGIDDLDASVLLLPENRAPGDPRSPLRSHRGSNRA